MTELFADARRVVGFPISVVGAIVWIVAAAFLITADAIAGRNDAEQLVEA